MKKIKLDTDQQKAVEHFEGPALVVAGPGSGKTTVIKERILHLIREHKVNPEQILAIAFTNAAVTELEERILGELNSNHEYPEIRTLHGFGKDIITDNHRQAGFSFPPAVWGGEIKPILKQERKRLEKDAADAIVAIYKIQSQTTGKCYIGQSINPTRRKEQHFRNSSNSRLRQAIKNEGSSQFIFQVIERVRGTEANERESHWMEYYRNSSGVFNSTNPLRQQYSNQLLIELLCQFFNARDIEQFKKILQEVMIEKSKVETGLFVPNTINDSRVRTFAEKYEAARQKTDAVDFQDMLIYSAHLLESCPSLCQYYCDKYPYVLIDEFQDISLADFRLLKLLSDNIFAVGDDDQAIYGFRGGDSKIMLEFAEQQKVSKYEITRNYRSTSTIVAHARALIEKNTPRIPKNLRPQNPRQQEIKIIESTPRTIETILLPELILSEETVILTRTNYEIEKIQEMFDDQPFPIEVSTIHNAKGKEWEKVILMVNTLDVWDNGTPYISFPDTRNEIIEERRVFYVAITRAKRELVVLGRHCQFISEFQNVPPTKRELVETFGLDRIVEIYLDRLIFAFKDKYKLSNINKNTVKQKMVKYLLELGDEAIQEIGSFASKNVAEVMQLKRYVDYCAEKERIHLCTNEFRNFWKRMWEIIEQSRNLSESQTKEADPRSSKIKQVQPSVDLSVPSYTEFTDGEIVKGVVVDITRNEVMIDIGFKSKGYIPASEFDTERDNLPAVQVGNEIDVYIVQCEDSEGQIVLSKKIADQTLIWDEIATAYETGTPVIGRIIEQIKGGLRVSVGSLRGFLPTSQVELRPIQNLGQYVGQTLEMKVISLNKRRHDIVLSRRAWLEVERVQKRLKILNTLKVGQSLIGVVKNITNFGAFVDLGGVDGLLHKSEMAWERINHPSQVVSVGEEVEVKVIEFDQENGKISLSLKQMTSEPWEDVEVKYPIGSKVSGVVVNIVDYGAFVQLEEGIIGLVHVSEMPLVLNNVLALDILNKDDELEVTVLKVSKDSKRIALGIKSYQQNPFEEKAKIDGTIPEESSEVIAGTPIEEVEETNLPVEETVSVLGVEKDCSYEIVDPITPETVQAVDNNQSPILQNPDEIRRAQIQNLKPATLEPDITSEPPVTVNSNVQKTPQEYDDILLRQIQELKAEIYDPEKRGNITQEPTSETEIDRETLSTPPDSSTVTDSDTPQIKEQESSKNREENSKKGLGYYLHRGGRVAREKIRTAIFKKPKS